MMKKMAMLQMSIQERIECFSQDPIEKAQNLLFSYTADDIRHCNDEVLIYLLSQDPEMVHVKKEILNRLEKYSQEWQEKKPEHQNPFNGEFKADRLRIAHWESISRMRNHLGRTSWLKELAFSRHTSEFTKIFNIFRADIHNSYLERKLKIVLDKLGDKLVKMRSSQSDTTTNIEHQIIVSKLIITMASLFVFGYTRVEGSAKTKPIGDLDQYLLKHLELYLSHCKLMKMGDVRIVAMAVHAICLAKTKGRTAVISQAVTWIMQQFQQYGYWGDEDSINTTVLVLDALELANGGDKVTFDISYQDKIKDELITKDMSINNQVLQISPEKIEINIKEQSINDFLEKILAKKKETTGEQNLTLSEIENNLIEDPINVEIIKIYQAVDTAMTGDIDSSALPFKKMPTQEQIAEHLYKKKLTSETLSKQAVSKRVQKLKKTGLIGLDDDFHDKVEHHDPHKLEDMSDKIKEKF